MAIFLRLIKEKDKSSALNKACQDYRNDRENILNFKVDMSSFDLIPSKPFSYWVSSDIYNLFSEKIVFETKQRTTKVGLATGDNFRFLRLWYEIDYKNLNKKWYVHVKGGPFTKFYSDFNLIINYENDGIEVKALAEILNLKSPGGRIKNKEYYFRNGFTWTLATTSNISFRVLPKGCIFDNGGPSGFVNTENDNNIFYIISLLNSMACSYLIKMLVGLAAEGRKNYVNGIINKIPFIEPNDEIKQQLAHLTIKGWSLKRNLDTVNETSHAFILPSSLRNRFNDYNSKSIEEELDLIENKIDKIAFGLYGFTEEDQIAATKEYQSSIFNTDKDEEDDQLNVSQNESLLSWAVGVAFARFDIKLANGERTLPSEPDPFDPLPDKSPGMLNEGETPFHNEHDILVDDPLNPNDLSNLVQKVLDTINVNISTDIRHWITTKFFEFHLKMYSKSRRKAPIYWPLSSPNGLYRIWIYYPSMTDQTLYAAVNKYLDPKIKYVQQGLKDLQDKAKRTSKEELQFEKIIELEQDLISFRDKLLVKAPNYKPHHDDGVEVTASPLADFFKHNSWRKALKTTWTKLEKGDYDWSYTAMDNWPERVKEKCKKDKSLAIAHDLDIMNK